MRAVLVSPARDRVAVVDAVIVVGEVVPVGVVYVAVVVHAGARDLPGVGLQHIALILTHTSHACTND
jgi:hypothetical protein